LNDAPACALTGRTVALATSSSNSIAAARPASRTAALEDGGSPWPARNFLSEAEQRYAAIEGEALAVAWGLKQTKYFTQGCDNPLASP